MPDTLAAEWRNGMELPSEQGRMQSLGAWKQSLDVSVKAFVAEVRGIAQALHRDGGRAARDLWARLCKAVVDEQTASVQGQRDDAILALKKYTVVLQQLKDLADFASRISGNELPEVPAVKTELSFAAWLLSSLEGRWRTAEDLEDLVAESMAPSAEKLEAISRKYGGPSEWYRHEAD